MEKLTVILILLMIIIQITMIVIMQQKPHKADVLPDLPPNLELIVDVGY